MLRVDCRVDTLQECRNQWSIWRLISITYHSLDIAAIQIQQVLTASRSQQYSAAFRLAWRLACTTCGRGQPLMPSNSQSTSKHLHGVKPPARHLSLQLTRYSRWAVPCISLLDAFQDLSTYSQLSMKTCLHAAVIRVMWAAACDIVGSRVWNCGRQVHAMHRGRLLQDTAMHECWRKLANQSFEHLSLHLGKHLFVCKIEIKIWTNTWLYTWLCLIVKPIE